MSLQLTHGLSCLADNAQDYIPFLTDGKVWITERVFLWPSTEEPRIEEWKIDGDSIVDNVQYRILYLDEELYCLLREEGKKVFSLYSESEGERLLYDFNLSLGDTYCSLNKDYQVIIDDEIISGEMNLHRIGIKSDGIVSYWVEGVGAMRDPVTPNYADKDGIERKLLSCTVGDVCLFSRYTSGGQNSHVITFEPGKVWCMETYCIGPDPVRKPGETICHTFYTIQETTEVNGQIYYKFSVERDRFPSPERYSAGYHSYLARESEGKIYLLSTSEYDDDRPEGLFFDYNMIESERTYEESILQRIEKKPSPGNSGLELRHYIFTHGSKFIEGVGYIDRYFFCLDEPTGAGHRLKYCRAADGTFLYGEDIGLGVNSPRMSFSQPSALYDLTGRRLTDAPKKGLYIKGGKKYVSQ